MLKINDKKKLLAILLSAGLIFHSALLPSVFAEGESEVTIQITRTDSSFSALVTDSEGIQTTYPFSSCGGQETTTTVAQLPETSPESTGTAPESPSSEGITTPAEETPPLSTGQPAPEPGEKEQFVSTVGEGEEPEENPFIVSGIPGDEGEDARVDSAAGGIPSPLETYESARQTYLLFLDYIRTTELNAQEAFNFAETVSNASEDIENMFFQFQVFREFFQTHQGRIPGILRTLENVDLTDLKRESETLRVIKVSVVFPSGINANDPIEQLADIINHYQELLDLHDRWNRGLRLAQLRVSMSQDRLNNARAALETAQLYLQQLARESNMARHGLNFIVNREEWLNTTSMPRASRAAVEAARAAVDRAQAAYDEAVENLNGMLSYSTAFDRWFNENVLPVQPRLESLRRDLQQHQALQQ